MPRVCTICAHPEREAIDAALVAETDSLRTIADHYAVSKSALIRHKRDHIPRHLAKAQEAQEVAGADELLAQLETLRADAARIGEKAERVSEFTAALSAIREQARIIELLLKVAGELAEAPTVNVLVMPEWLAVRAAMLAALGPYPQARQAVAGALLRLEDGDGRG